MKYLLVLSLFITYTNAIWHKELRGQPRLQALDRSKMLQVKIKGHGYFQYIMDATNRLDGLCSGSEDEEVGNIMQHGVAGNTRIYPTAADIPSLCSIRDSDVKGGPIRYKASSGFTLGATIAAGNYHNGGNKWSNAGNKIQINLERNSGVATSQSSTPVAGTVEYWNGDRATDMVEGNWIDPEVYALKINTAGNMRVYTSGSAAPGYVTVADAKWTLTGWGQTVLYGDVTETTTNGVTTTTLTVKDGIYRQFSADLDVNPQEDFLGTVYTEVVSYQTNTAVASIGEGTVFTVTLQTSKPCDDFYLDGTTTVQRQTECAALISSKVSSTQKLTSQIVYQSVYFNSGTTQRYTCEIYSVINNPVVYTASTGSSSYLCTNLLGAHYDAYETGTGAPVVYNKYGRFHVNRYGYLVDPNGVLLLGYQDDTVVKGGIHIPSRWQGILIDNYGNIIIEHDFGTFQKAGRFRLARFASEQGLGFYMNMPIQSRCAAENSLGFALGSWCVDTDLDGLDIWYYVESATSGDPIEGYPLDQGFGAVIQYNLASTAKDLYVGGVAPTI